MFIILLIHSKNSNSLTKFLKFIYKLKIDKTFKLRFYSIQSQQKKNFSFFSTLQSPHVNKKSQEQFEYSLHNKKLKINVSQIIKFLTIWKIVNIKMFTDIKVKLEFWIKNDELKEIRLTKLDYDKFKLPFSKKRNKKINSKLATFISTRKNGELNYIKKNKEKSSLILYTTLKRKKNSNPFVGLKQSNLFGKSTVIKTFTTHSRKKRKRTKTSVTSLTFLKLLDIYGEILMKNLSRSLDSSVGRAKDWKSLWQQFKSVSERMKNSLWNISTNLKNNQLSQRSSVHQPKTDSIITFLNILWNEGFILGYKIDTLNPSFLKIFLKYRNGNPIINSIKLISKPSRHIYYSVSQLWKLNSKKSLIVLTTSKGLMTIYECKKTRIGGTLVFIIK